MISGSTYQNTNDGTTMKWIYDRISKCLSKEDIDVIRNCIIIKNVNPILKDTFRFEYFAQRAIFLQQLWINKGECPADVVSAVFEDYKKYIEEEEEIESIFDKIVEILKKILKEILSPQTGGDNNTTTVITETGNEVTDVSDGVSEDGCTPVGVLVSLFTVLLILEGLASLQI